MDSNTFNRFIKFVKKTESCWFWIGSKKGSRDYGSFSINNKDYRAHRVSYEHFYGDFDKSLNVLHKCDNPSCVRPEHLFLGTHKENMQDKVNKNRQSSLKREKCPTHKLTEIQVSEIKEKIKYPYRGYLKDIAKQYLVSDSCIADIKAERTWKDRE
jgi:hypothetical protein